MGIHGFGKRLAATASITAAALVGLAGPALAGAPPAVVPGPLLGVGAPALALFAGGYWLVRRLRNRE